MDGLFPEFSGMGVWGREAWVGMGGGGCTACLQQQCCESAPWADLQPHCTRTWLSLAVARQRHHSHPRTSPQLPPPAAAAQAWSDYRKGKASGKLSPKYPDFKRAADGALARVPGRRCWAAVLMHSACWAVVWHQRCRSLEQLTPEAAHAHCSPAPPAGKALWVSSRGTPAWVTQQLETNDSSGAMGPPPF